MSKLLLGVLVVLLVFSLGGVAYFAVEVSKQNTVITKLNQHLKEADGELSAKEKQLAETEEHLFEVKENLIDTKAELGKGQETIDDLRKENDVLDRQLIQWRVVKCNITMLHEDVKSISTNQGLIELITKTVEDDMGFSSVTTSFEIVWNNSKTAIFTIVDQDRATAKIAASWDFDTGEILGIYNLNRACIYYPS